MQIPAEITVNANAAECIKSASYWGHTAYHNICTNTHVDVPWGAMDYAGPIGLAVLFGSIAILCVGLAVMMIRDI